MAFSVIQALKTDPTDKCGIICSVMNETVKIRVC